MHKSGAPNGTRSRLTLKVLARWATSVLGNFETNDLASSTDNTIRYSVIERGFDKKLLNVK